MTPLDAPDFRVAFAEALATLPPEGRRVVEEIRRGQPVRTTGGRRSSSGRFSSLKMGKVIQFESRTLEGAACWQYEFEPTIAAFYDQPWHLKITWRRNNRGVWAMITPDFFVVSRDAESGSFSVRFEEWHSDRDLRESQKKDPDRYLLTPDGIWIDTAAREAAQSLGLDFRVRTERDISAVLVRNLEILFDYYSKPYDLAPTVRQAAVDLVRSNPAMTLEALLSRVPGMTIDDAYALIASDLLWVDLRDALVKDREKVTLFASRDVAAFVVAAPTKPVSRGEVLLTPGSWFVWAGKRWCVIAADALHLQLLSVDGEPIKLLRSAIAGLVHDGDITGLGSVPPSRAELLNRLTPKARKRLDQRLCAVGSYLDGKRPAPDRTTKDWLRKYRDAESLLGDGVFGLVPDFQRCGRRGPRVDERVRRLAQDVLEQHFLRPERPSLRSAFKLFKGLCAEQNVAPFCWLTFQREERSMPRERTLHRREGHRSAAAGALKSRQGPELPKDGDRALQRVHFDHTQKDLVLVDPESARVLGQPWLSLAIDAHTGRALGHVLRYDAPSTEATLLLIRDVVRRHGRLPQIIVTDSGADFKSTFLEQLAGAFQFHLERRPVGNARFGAPVERAFGLIDAHLTYSLRGNTQNAKVHRLGTKEVDPKPRAVWTLGRFNDLIETFLYDQYDSLPDASLGLSPRERFERSVLETGERPQMYVAFDRGFLIQTCPTTRKGTARVGQQGVKILGVNYWCEAFRQPRMFGVNVPVRWDPLNRGIAYAKVNGEWLDCHSKYYSVLKGRSGQEIAHVTAEIRQRLRLRSVSEVQLAREIQTRISEEESDLLSKRRAAEQRGLIEKSGLAVVDRAADTVAKLDDDPLGHISADDLIDLESPEWRAGT